jgi:hypothetical protein
MVYQVSVIPKQNIPNTQPTKSIDILIFTYIENNRLVQNVGSAVSNTCAEDTKHLAF